MSASTGELHPPYLDGWSGGGRWTSLGRGLKLSRRALLRGASGVRAVDGGGARTGIGAGAEREGAAATPKTLAVGLAHQLGTTPLLVVVMLDVLLTLRMPIELVADDRATLPGRGRLHAMPPAAGVARGAPAAVRTVCAVPGVARTAVRAFDVDGAAVDGVGGTLRLTVDPTAEPDEDEATEAVRPLAEGGAAPARERWSKAGRTRQGALEEVGESV